MSINIHKRDECITYGYYYNNIYNDCYYNGFLAYGRWILLAAVILIFVLSYVSFSWITARRRRSRGQTPFPLTGWVPGPPPYSVSDENAPPKYPEAREEQPIELARLPPAHA